MKYVSFRNITDWKEQFISRRNERVRIGYLLALQDGEDFNRPLDWQDDVPRKAAATIWAAEVAIHQPLVLTQACSGLVNVIYGEVVRIRRWDNELGDVVKFFRRPEVMPVFERDPLVRLFDKFLTGVMSELFVAPSEIQFQVIRTVCEFGRYDLLNRSEWMGHSIILDVLRGKLRLNNMDISKMLTGSKTHQRMLASAFVTHLAATGDLDVRAFEVFSGRHQVARVG